MSLLFAAALAFVVPPLICFAIYKWLRKTRWAKTAYLLPISLLAAYCFIWYKAFYPSNEFYEKEFTEITGNPWPSSANITDKAASYPDQHGDYSCCVAIAVSRPDFDNLLQIPLSH